MLSIFARQSIVDVFSDLLIKLPLGLIQGVSLSTKGKIQAKSDPQISIPLCVAANQ